MSGASQRLAAFKKLSANPNRLTFCRTWTGNGAVLAKWASTSRVSSAETSSQATTSTGGHVWRRILASSSGKCLAPLYVPIATETPVFARSAAPDARKARRVR